MSSLVPPVQPFQSLWKDWKSAHMRQMWVPIPVLPTAEGPCNTLKSFLKLMILVFFNCFFIDTSGYLVGTPLGITGYPLGITRTKFNKQLGAFWKLECLQIWAFCFLNCPCGFSCSSKYTTNLDMGFYRKGMGEESKGV